MPGGFFGWGSPFGRESLDQYRDKERTRSRDLFVDRQLSRPSIASPTRSRDFLSSIGDTVGKSLREVRDASLAPKQISQQPRKGGGGFLSKAKKIGKGALDTLDAAAETTRDLAEPGLRSLPVSGHIFGIADALGVTKAPSLRDTATLNGIVPNAIRSRGNPAGFMERQKSDLYKRGTIDQIATQTVFDPTNLVGAAAVTKGLRGASVARQGTLTGRLFAGAAKANELADVAQTKFAREAVGGTLGFTASALSGGDTRQNLEAAGAGVLAGRLSRYVGKQGAEAARIGRAFPVGAQTVDEGAQEAVNLAPSPAASRKARLAERSATNPAEVRQTATATEDVATMRPPVEPPPSVGATVAEPPREMTDMLRRRGRDTVVGERQDALQGRVERMKPQVKSNPEVDAVRVEKERTDHIVREATGARVDILRARAERAGLRIEPGENSWVVAGTNVPLEDVVEGATPEAVALRAKMSDEQRAVLDEVQSMNQRWNDTIQIHGGEVPKRETGTGDYWPRKVLGKEVNDEFLPKNAGGGAKASNLGRSRISTRTQESVAAGAADGITYENPWEALKAGMRTKARIAQENYLARMIEPLAVTDPAQRGFGARALKANHPLLEKFKYVGTTDSGLGMVGREARAFPNDVADQLDTLLSPTRLDQAPVGKQIAQVNSVALPLRASGDISAFMNQGMGFLESNPRNFMKSFTGMADTIASASGNPERYYGMIEGEATRAGEALTKAGIKADPVEWLVQHGMHYADENPAAGEEFLFPDSSKWADKLKAPGKALGAMTDWSNDVFARYLNYSRMTLATDQLERAVAQGMKGEALDKHMDDAMKSLNRMSGWTGSKTSSLENIALFAPRFFRANIEQVVAAFTKGGIEGSIARQHLVKLVATASVLTYGANAARGYNTDVDPRSNNFMRIRNVGGQDISLLGPFATLVRAGAQGVAGQPGATADVKGRGITHGTNGINVDPMAAIVGDNFSGGLARAKASPALSTAWSLLSGSTYDGRPIEANPLDASFYTKTLPDMAREQVPFAAQALGNQGIEPAIRNRDPGALLHGAEGAALSAIGAQSSEVTPSENRDFRRDDVAREKFGKAYADLSGAEKSQVNEDPKIAADQKEAERRQLETGNKATAVAKDFRDKMAANGRYLSAGKDDAGRTFTGNDYRDAYGDAIQQRLGGMKAAGGFQGNDAVSQYYDLYDKATQANGSIDRTKLEQLQADFRAKNPNIDDQVAKVAGVRDDATLRQFREAQKQASEYYQLPAYKSLSVDESERASEIIKRANGLASAGVVRSQKDGLARLVQSGEITPEERSLAIRAQRLGANPARKAFKTEPAHEAFRLFYNDITAAEAAGVKLAESGTSVPLASESTRRRRTLTRG